MRRMMEAVDGEYQTFKSKDGAYVREHFFNTPELKELVADWSDEDIWDLNRGGHDPHKVYAAYHAAVDHKGQPTVILAKTIKGYGMGESGEAQNITHQQKKMSRRGDPALPRPLRDPGSGRRARGSAVRQVRRRIARARVHARAAHGARRLPADAPAARPSRSRCRDSRRFERFLKSTEDREISTTMAFVQILQTLLRDKNLGKHIVPIVPDESRTFGMEGMFRQLGDLEPARPAVHAARTPTS